MIANAYDWDEELPAETEDEVYRALLRALRRKQGFGLFFVQCSTSQGNKVVANLRRDLSGQRIQSLHLEGEVTALYDPVAELWQQEPFDLLVIEGLQASLYAYEDTKRFSGWSSSDIYNYSWKGVPQLLNHLNQRRELFRNDFPARFVFLVPSFVVDYFVQRAADFLDWRSGLFRFPPDQRELLMDAERFALEGGYTEYLTLTNEARRKKILELKSLQEICPDSERKAKLLFEIGLLFFAEEDNENALTSWDKALDIKPDNHTTLFFRGIALDNLGRKKEAIASYDKGLEFNPGNHHHIWTLRGVALFALERYVEAIASYDKAIQFKPDDHETWHKRGLALTYLRLYQEALMSYDKALKIKPNFASAYYNKACCYGLQKNTDLAIETLKQAITLDSKYRELAKNDSDFDSIREDERFQALIKE